MSKFVFKNNMDTKIRVQEKFLPHSPKMYVLHVKLHLSALSTGEKKKNNHYKHEENISKHLSFIVNDHYEEEMKRKVFMRNNI